MSGLKISSISLEKESWESVPRLLYNAFHVFSLNMTNIKQWAEKVEAQSKMMSQEHADLEARVDTMDATIQTLQGSVKTMSDHITAVASEHQAHVDLFSTCLHQLLLAVGGMTGDICRNFNVIDQEDTYFKRELNKRRSSAPAPEDLAMTGSRSTSSRRSTSKELKGMTQAVPPVPHALRVLQELSNRLEPRLMQVSEALELWAQWRQRTEGQWHDLQAGITELQDVQRRLRERLFAWCSVQKESACEVDSLHASLKRTRTEILELRASQVQYEQVEQAISSRAQELQSAHDSLKGKVGGLAECLEAHVEEVSCHMQEVETSVNERIDRHANSTAQLLKTSLDPMSAYLNKLHVSTDVMRMDLDTLQEQLPKIVDSVSDVGSKLQVSDESHGSKTTELDKRIDVLGKDMSTLTARDKAQHEEVSASLEALVGTIDTELGKLHAADETVSAAIEEVKLVDLSQFASDMRALEQKVVKWVQAEPLPQKISEARLYALEAKLAEEMEARLMIEEQLKDLFRDTLARSDVPVKPDGSAADDTDGALALLPLLPRSPRKPSALKSINVSPKLTKHTRSKSTALTPNMLQIGVA